MTSMSEIHVCHPSLDVAPARPLLTTQSKSDPVATTSSLYTRTSSPENIELTALSVTHPSTPSITSETTTATTLQQVIWAN